MGGFPSLKSADSIRLTKAEKRLGKKASEKFIDVRTGPKPSSPKKKKSGSPKPNSKAGAPVVGGTRPYVLKPCKML